MKSIDQRAFGRAGKSSGARRPVARLRASPPPHRQPFLAIEPLGSLAVHDQPFPAQQDVQTPVAEAAALGCKLPHASRAAAVIGRSPGPIADHLAVHTCDGYTPAARSSRTSVCR